MDTTNNLLARIEADLSVSEDAMRSIPAEAAKMTEAAAGVPDQAPHPIGEVIDTYSRAQAIEDGTLIAVEEGIALEAGFRVPIALTAAAWEDCVAWDEADSRRQTPQDQSGRLWDVLFMTAQAARRYRNASRMTVELYRVPRGGRARAARLVRLAAVIGPGDSAEPVMTIMQPDED